MLQLSHRMSQLGTEAAFEVLARASALQRQGRDIVNLCIGQPDFPTPDHIVEAGRKALADGHHGYTPPTASCRCARRWSPTCTAATASRSRPSRCWSCRAAR